VKNVIFLIHVQPEVSSKVDKKAKWCNGSEAIKNEGEIGTKWRFRVSGRGRGREGERG